jgi:hypothetical protein
VASSFSLADLSGGPISAIAWSYVKWPMRLFQSILGVAEQPMNPLSANSNATAGTTVK